MWMEATVSRYGQGNFTWIAMMGGLSAMHDEIDPALACEMAHEAIDNLPRLTGVVRYSGEKARLLYEVWVALELCPETPGGG